MNDIVTAEELNAKDFTSDQEIRWCPGCGDFAIVKSVRKALAEIGTPTENVVFVSGIGCAARFPYYMATYGFHTIHGRAPAIATGVKLANPDLDVWVVGGDGDMLSIGGNHLIHALRRNVNLNILLFNNQIYGLTKGQFSPTSQKGKVTKSSPVGLVSRPFNPISVALGAEATFVARTHDMDRRHMQEVFRRAYEHEGSSFVEVLQNCNVFNDGVFSTITKKDVRDDMLIDLHHGKPILFGSEKQYGVARRPEGVVIVEVAEVGIEYILVHDETIRNPSTAFSISRLAKTPATPTPIGVFRAIDSGEFGRSVAAQIREVQAQMGRGDLASLLRSQPTWEV